MVSAKWQIYNKATKLRSVVKMADPHKPVTCIKLYNGMLLAKQRLNASRFNLRKPTLPKPEQKSTDPAKTQKGFSLDLIMTLLQKTSIQY